jgi:ankyrin repeat protein
MAKLLADAIRDAASGQLDARESKTGRSPAMVAADAGHWDLVRTLVKAGANPNQMDFGDASYHEPTRSLSHRAASTGSASLMRQLHAHGADLSLRDGHGIPVLFHAVAGNAPDKREMIDDIVRCGGDIHGKYGKNGETALMMAARIGDARTVEHLLVTHRVDPNALSDRGMSAVMVAAIADKAEVIEVLHRHGAMLEAQNGIGFRAAHFAASNNSAKALAMLGKLGADLAAHTSTSHDTPLSLAKTMESKECLSILDAPAQASRRAAQLLTMLGAHGTPDSRSRPPGP